jgi:hypothetical protein
LQINTKAVVIGLVALIVLSALSSLLAGMYLPNIYNSVVMSGHASTSQTLYTAFLALVQFGPPGYLTAAVAQRSKTVHAFVVGLLGGLLVIALSWPEVVKAPLLTLGTLVISILIATLAGKLRQVTT